METEYNETSRRMNQVEKEIGRKKHFVQTYIVLFGLLLSYGENASAQEAAMQYFIFFMAFIILYYFILTKIECSPSGCFVTTFKGTIKPVTRREIVGLNLSAMMSSIALSLSIAIYVEALFGDTVLIIGSFYVFMVFIFISLSFNSTFK